jgi:Ca2+-binding RTX toxin-like protein
MAIITASGLIVGTDTPDTITGSGGADTIYGYEGDGDTSADGPPVAPIADPAGGGAEDDDLINGGGGADAIDAGGGDDTIRARENEAEFDTIQGGDGTDTLEVLGGSASISSTPTPAASRSSMPRARPCTATGRPTPSISAI